MKKLTLMAPLAALLLTACGAADALIAKRSAPDEMAVVDGPKLSLPPNFELRPPKDKYQAQAEKRAERDERVKKLLIGTKKTTSDVETTDEWLVKKAGGEKRDPNIRKKLQGDDVFELKEADKGFWGKQKDRLFGEEVEHPAVQELKEEVVNTSDVEIKKVK